jgi:hypothetical protein
VLHRRDIEMSRQAQQIEFRPLPGVPLPEEFGCKRQLL